jgi:hypothetical protein
MELQECNELMFVMEGRYNVGFEINKKEFFRRHFGPSTIIGGFQMCFQTRFLFVMRASQ